MDRYVVERLMHAAAVLLGVTSLVFGLIHLSGDPLAGLAPPGSSPEQQALIRRRYELDRPLATQYASFLGRAARGDFGESWRQRRPAMEAVLERLPASAALALGATGLALLVGVPLGVIAGARAGGLTDAAARTVAVLGQALPGFWLGSLLILLFAVHLHWLPSSGADGPRSLVLPVVTLAAYPTATVVRLLRSSLREQLAHDYIRTARGKGLSRRAVIGHGLRNAVLPTLAFVGLQVGFLLGGAVVVESVFAYPGIGRLALDAVADRDVPVIQAFVVVVAVLIVLTNEVVDVVARLLDPRLRSSMERGSVLGALG